MLNEARKENRLDYLSHNVFISLLGYAHIKAFANFFRFLLVVDASIFTKKFFMEIKAPVRLAIEIKQGLSLRYTSEPISCYFEIFVQEGFCFDAKKQASNTG